MKQRIRTSLILIAFIAVFTTTFSIALYYYNLFQTQVKTDLRNAALLLENYDFTNSSLGTTVESDIRITVVDSDGTVLYDNDIQNSILDKHSDRPEVIDAFALGTGEAIRVSDTLGMNTYYYAVKLPNNTVLRLAKDSKNLTNVFLQSLPLIGTISVLIIAFCISISTWLTKKMLEPIEETVNHLEDPSIKPEYKELIPFISTIQKQHADILSAVKVRQDFCANISHELKTPLTAISGYAELIENKMVDEKKQVEFAGEIQRNAHRLVTLINDIIRLSELDNIKEIELEEVDFYKLIKEAIPNLNELAKQKNVTIHFDGQPIKLLSNSLLLEELVYNLCQNAIQYNVENGHVYLKLEKLDNEIVFTVKDTGIGVPKDQQKRIFERFYRVDKSRSKKTGGTGLGLAIVKHIVEAIDATITLESDGKKGTTVTVTF